MLIRQSKYGIIAVILHNTLSGVESHANLSMDNRLEEIVVTAQKREQSLQAIPLAVSVLNEEQLNTLGVTSLSGLKDSVIPSLRINANGLSPSSLTIAIRGDGAADVGQPTRQGAVAVYLDNIYLGRAQGLNMELADLQRIEVLRGPQGTLFGRNATTGAVNIVLKKPTGVFGLKQTVTIGHYDAFRSLTQISLPAIAGVSAKLDYMHSGRDGWVKNTFSRQADFNEYDKNGGRFALNVQVTTDMSLDYAYDQSDIENTQMYYQLYEDFRGRIGRERNRETTTRFPLVLEPVDVDVEGHALTVNWQTSENIALKSLSSYRSLDEDGFNNHGGAVFFVGLILDEDIKQEQYSQEFQLTGEHKKLEWATGLYYFKEETEFDFQTLISLDDDFNPINPPVAISDVTTVISDAESLAVYGQGMWTFNESVQLTIGARFTEDQKTAKRAGLSSRNIDSSHTDASLALTYYWQDHVSTYVRWANAYKAGGYNARSVSFQPYDEEVNSTWEVGFKSEWFDRHLRFNAAIFSSEFEDKQFDFMAPSDPLVVETLNAVKKSEITGVEIDIMALLFSNMIAGLHYTYLDSDMPLQPHPTEPGNTQAFTLSMAPQHAGSFTLDYTVAPMSFGVMTLHLDVTSTDRYAFSNFPVSREDAYTLINARITLKNIVFKNTVFKNDKSTLSIAAWCKNLTDEEYVVLGFPVGTPPSTVNHIFGTPRTAGIDIVYEY